MLKKLRIFTVAGLVAFSSIPSQAQEVLTGDTRLACEAVMCLASSVRPGECQPSLRKYFSISARKLRDTIRGRVNFLRLCPASQQTPQMSSLVEAISNGAGRCDAGSLNLELVQYISDGDSYTTIIGNQLPDYCGAYMNNGLTNLTSTMPKYVGLPERGGKWVEPDQYDQALAEYNARIAAEDAERARLRQHRFW